VNKSSSSLDLCT